jgi:hypothetical protein
MLLHTIITVGLQWVSDIRSGRVVVVVAACPIIIQDKSSVKEKKKKGIAEVTFIT